MVKVVVGDQAQLELAEEQISQFGVTPQVGLVIGKLSLQLDRGYIYCLIPTPQNESGDPACSLTGEDLKKKGSKPKSAAPNNAYLTLDFDWIAEHARQVSRMMVGGVKVIGIYVSVSETVFKNSTAALCQTLMSVSEAASLTNTRADESLLLHISYSPRRWICRNFTPSSSFSSNSLRPCEFKMGKVLNHLQTFKSDYNFELRLPVIRESSNTFSNILRKAIITHGKDLKDAKFFVDGNLVLNEEPLTAEGQPHNVVFIQPFSKSSNFEAFEKNVSGTVVLRGAVSAFSCSNTKEPLSEAVADIRDDIITTLRSRVDTMCEALEDDEQPTIKAIVSSLEQECSLPLPKRVLIPWLTGLFICDYLLPLETPEAVRDHCKELFSMEMSNVLEPEAQSDIPSLEAREAICGSNIEPQPANAKQKNALQSNFSVFSVFVLLLAIVIGLVIFSQR